MCSTLKGEQWSYHPESDQHITRPTRVDRDGRTARHLRLHGGMVAWVPLLGKWIV